MLHRLSCRPLLAVGLLVATLGLLAQAQEVKENSAVKPQQRGPGRVKGNVWLERHNAMNARVKQGNVDLLFIGDSITQRWQGTGNKTWVKYYGKRNAVNLGISGDRTGHVLWRLDHGNIDGISPKLAVIMIGTNNSGENTPEQTAEGIAAIVGKLRAKLPQTKILLLGIFPRGADDKDPPRQVNMKTNAFIAKLADEKTVFYMDISDKFLRPDRTLSEDAMPDLVHPGMKGYAIWAAAIEPLVAKVLGDTPVAPEATEAKK
jgi:lysophospholipase L1-like esterase